MNQKCSYCWKPIKDLKNLIKLHCKHLICKNCLKLLNSRDIIHCPICNQKITDEITYENLKSGSGKDLSIVPLETSNLINLYKLVSKNFLTLSKPILVIKKLENLESSLAELPNKCLLSVSEIILRLQIIRDFNIQEVLRYETKEFSPEILSKNTRRSFLKILFSKILYHQTDQNILWLGSKLRNLGDLNCPLTVNITNQGNIKLKLVSIGFGIDFFMPNTFYCDKIYFQSPSKQFYVNGKELVKDQTKFFFVLNILDLELRPSETLKITFQVGNGYYLAVKDQEVHYFRDCPIITTNYSYHNIISYLRLI